MHNSVASSSGAPSTAPAAAGAWPSAPHVPAQARPPFPEPEARSLYHLRPDRVRDPRSHAERPLLNPYSEELNKQRQLWSGAERVALGMSLGVAGHRVSLRPNLWSYSSERELNRVFDREWTWLGKWLNEANIAAWNAGCAAAASPQAPKGIRILLTREIHVALLLSDDVLYLPLGRQSELLDLLGGLRQIAELEAAEAARTWNSWLSDLIGAALRAAPELSGGAGAHLLSGADMIHAAPQGVSALRNHMRAESTAQGQHPQYTTLQTRSALHELGRGLMTGGLSLLVGGLALHAGLSLSGSAEATLFDGLNLALVGGLGWIAGNAITRAHPGQSPRLADWIAAHRRERYAPADSRTPLGQWVIASGSALYGARDVVHLKVLEQQSRRRRPEQLLLALGLAWSLTGSVWPLIAVTLLCALPWGARGQAPTFEWPDLVPDDQGEAFTGS